MELSQMLSIWIHHRGKYFEIKFNCYGLGLCGRVPVVKPPDALQPKAYKPWSLVVPNCTARCLHQRP